MKVEISIKLEKIDDKILSVGDNNHVTLRPSGMYSVELELPDSKKVVLDIKELSKALDLLSQV